MGERMTGRRIWASNSHAGRRVPLAWARLLKTHAVLIRQMDATLRASHGLTINDYEVLLRLSWAPDGRLSRRQLADSVHLTQGGITRLLDGLERAGLVTSAPSDTDRRVVHARLTEAGRARLRAAARTHTDDIASLFTARFSPEELATLAELLAGPADAEDSEGLPGSAVTR
jgi:DNA-binding MarR family transcriptional regulator